MHIRPAGRTAGEDGRCKEEEPYVHARKQGGNMDGHSPADGARGFASSFSAGTIMGEKGGDSRSKRRPWKGGWPTATAALHLPRPGWLKIWRSICRPAAERPRRGQSEPAGRRPELVKGTRGDGDGGGFPARPASGRSGSSGTVATATGAGRPGRAASGSLSPILLSPGRRLLVG